MRKICLVVILLLGSYYIGQAQLQPISSSSFSPQKELSSINLPIKSDTPQILNKIEISRKKTV